MNIKKTYEVRAINFTNYRSKPKSLTNAMKTADITGKFPRCVN